MLERQESFNTLLLGFLKEGRSLGGSHGSEGGGHGFGLHSSALAAQELGGSLTVHSDGPGQGATFTLELPFHPAGEAPTA